MKFPARGFAVVLWIAAVAVVAMQQYLQPAFQISMFHSGIGIWSAVDSLTRSIMYGGSIAAIGTIVHLLGEIRDLTARIDPKEK